MAAKNAYQQILEEKQRGSSSSGSGGFWGSSSSSRGGANSGAAPGQQERRQRQQEEEFYGFGEALASAVEVVQSGLKGAVDGIGVCVCARMAVYECTCVCWEVGWVEGRGLGRGRHAQT